MVNPPTMLQTEFNFDASAEIWADSTKQKTGISRQGIQHKGTGNDSTDKIIPVLQPTRLLTIQQSNKEHLPLEETVR